MSGKLRIVAVGAIVMAVSAGPVLGDETNRGGFDLALSTATPGATTAAEFHVLYKHPDDPEAKPPPVTAAVFDLPAGMKIDDGAIPQCAASDNDFRAQGRAACPAESQVGDGILTVMTGFPGVDPLELDVVAFNGDGQLIEVVFAKGTNTVAGMDRLTIEDGKLVAHPPSTPGGPPDGRTAVRELRLELPLRVGAGGRPYVTAPPDCPTGIWKARAHYEFADGGKTVVKSESPCTRAPTLRVSVTPRRAKAGTPTRFRIVARSTAARCVEGARVRLGRLSTRTDAGGHASLTATFRKPGLKRVVVSKPGCGTVRRAVAVH